MRTKAPVHSLSTLLSIALLGSLLSGNPALAGGGKGYDKHADKAYKDDWKAAEKFRKDFYKHQAKGQVGYNVNPYAIPPTPYLNSGIQPSFGAGGVYSGYGASAPNGAYPGYGNGGYFSGFGVNGSDPGGVSPYGPGGYGPGGYGPGYGPYQGYPISGGSGYSQPQIPSGGQLNFSGSVIWENQPYYSPSLYP
jgi:hypothetical protein